MGENLSMATTAREVRDFIYEIPFPIEDKPRYLMAGIEDGVDKIYKVNKDRTISPSTTKEGIGSGHLHALQILEEGYQEDMRVKEAIALAQRALTWAIIKDWMTGGIIHVYYMANNGRVHRESFETEMELDIEEAKIARIGLREKFNNGEFDVDNLISEVQYVDD
ncbi:hypothetical protein QN277_025632 [Acacia crassicarpa]|uniref:Uncharacterized protein n=1 Tax=Acacia crassicarpa TaxID=499986 RepID=A0AAE1MJT2_9FABA|nr:hypothetical protein QN277_025632 [Acacia crassicarpa]